MDNLVRLQKQYLKDDVAFNELYPDDMRALAGKHWTPLRVARLAADFLTSGPPSKVLDVGSGVGKFCLAGACYAPRHSFYGIEQRAYITAYAETAREQIGVPNVSFLHGNFTELDLQQFDHFYFFNSFYENLDDEGRIDDHIEYSEAQYRYYVRCLHKGLQGMPEGTRIATYHSLYEEIPLSYDLVDSLEAGNLNFWIKRRM